MEREIVRHLLEQLEGRFSFYKVSFDRIEAKVASSGFTREFTEKRVKQIIDELIDRSGLIRVSNEIK